MKSVFFLAPAIIARIQTEANCQMGVGISVVLRTTDRPHASGETFGAAGYLHTRSFHLWFGN